MLLLGGTGVDFLLQWDELDDPVRRPDAFTIRDTPPRLAGSGDLSTTGAAPGQVFFDCLGGPARLGLPGRAAWAAVPTLASDRWSTVKSPRSGRLAGAEESPT